MFSLLIKANRPRMCINCYPWGRLFQTSDRLIFEVGVEAGQFPAPHHGPSHKGTRRNSTVRELLGLVHTQIKQRCVATVVPGTAVGQYLPDHMGAKRQSG